MRAAYIEVVDRALVAALSGSKCCVTSNIPTDARIFAMERDAARGTTKFFIESVELAEVQEGSVYPTFWAHHTSKDCHREGITFYSTGGNE